MNDEMKDCPRCAEQIRAKAVVCRFCGHEMAGSPMPPAGPPEVRSLFSSGPSGPRQGRAYTPFETGFGGCVGCASALIVIPILLLMVVLAIGRMP